MEIVRIGQYKILKEFEEYDMAEVETRVCWEG